MKSLKFLYSLLFCCSILSTVFNTVAAQHIESIPAERKKIMVISSIDKTEQPSYLYLPAAIKPKEKIPLVVFLHTWSNDLEQRFEPLEKQVASRGWLLLAPNFRGRNDHPEACGSILAQHDILDAVNWVKKYYSINNNRIYLVGFSGGGYLTMLMSALYPKQWAAASAWCGISDLNEWYQFHEKDNYGQMMRQCFGGGPGQSDTIALQYRNRSPITHLSKSIRVPLDIAAGRNDSIVPPLHSINAFNALAKAGGYPVISKEDIDKVLEPELIDGKSKRNESIIDTTLGKRIFFRRQEGKYRITIYDGKHEWVPTAAIQWFDDKFKK